MQNINKPTQRSVAVSSVPILFGDRAVTAPPVVIPVNALAVRQAATVLAMGSCPWLSRQRAGSILASRRTK